jgi:hypothetical protein
MMDFLLALTRRDDTGGGRCDYRTAGRRIKRIGFRLPAFMEERICVANPRRPAYSSSNIFCDPGVLQSRRIAMAKLTRFLALILLVFASLFAAGCGDDACGGCGWDCCDGGDD